MGQLWGQSGVETVEQLSSTFARLKNETTAWMTAIGEGLASTIQPFLADLPRLSHLTASASILRDYRKIIQDKCGALADETRIVLAAYNAGIGNVVRAIEETQRIGEQVTYG